MRVIMMTVASVLAIVGGCRDASGVAGGTVENASLALAVDLTESVDIAQVRLIVQAADLAEPLLFSLAIEAGEARGTAFVPVGPQRLFTLQALDDVGTLRYEGAATVDVTAGSNPPLTIVMAATGESGDVPIVGTLGGLTLEVAPSSLTIDVGEQASLQAIVRDPWGAVVSDVVTTWVSIDPAVARIDPSGTVLGVASGSTTIVARYSLATDTVSVTVLTSDPGEPPPTLDEPFFDASNAGHVSHVFEDWSTQTSVGAIESTNRIDGGAPWEVSVVDAVSLQGPDPFGSVRSVRTSYPGPGQTARGIRTPAGPASARNLEAGVAAGAVVLEWAARYSGTTAYMGKTMDWNNGSRGRFNYDPIAGSFGSRSNAECALDPLCARYYQSGVPQFPGLLPSNGTWSPNVFVINEDIPAVDGRFTNTMQYKQNAGWPQFQWGTGGEAVRDNQWRRYKLRYTKSPPGYPLGYGRLEMWVRQPDGTTVKIMNYIGDPGGREEGLVFIGDIIRPQLDGINIRVYEISAHINPGGAVVDIGYIRVWSHPRQP